MIRTAASACILFTAVAGYAQGQASDPSGVVAALIEQTGSPGAAAARACPDIHEAGAAGLRIEGALEPVGAGDLWHMGSNTKAMTATLAARLVEQGVIAWTTTIGEGLAALELDIADTLREATLEDLLSHRSGMTANAGLLTTMGLAGADADRDVRADRLTYAQAVLPEAGGPRGAFAYSNAGYVIAALMMEQAAGRPYETLMSQEVFAPMGMDGAGWGPPGEPGAADQPRGHRPGLFGGLGAREPGAGADNPPAMNSAGRLHLPLDDLLEFLMAHRDRPEAYLSSDSWAQLHAPRGGGDYALGWGVRADGSLAHAGSNTMWFARMVIDEPSGCVAVVVVNDGRIDTVSGPVSAALDALTRPVAP
jgi:CubicO group peptidase (beta-lactamase class C family)